MFTRSSGILLGINSLPGEYGIGDFGKNAYEFVDFLEKSGQKLWQILPLGQTGYGDSPYQCFSAFSGNIYFIDLNELAEKKLLDEKDLIDFKEKCREECIDYEQIYYEKIPVLKKAFKKYLEIGNEEISYGIEQFTKMNSQWLENYGLYMALKDHFGGKSWTKWPKAYKLREKKVLEAAKIFLGEEVDYHIFLQYIFSKQWERLKGYANNKGIKIVGDIPIFVAEDSADTWSESKLFDFDKYKRIKNVAGCPPDAFSKDGQFWGNPQYNWGYMKKTKYDWWIKRVEASFQLYDILRIDHFRGFESFWEIPSYSKTAKSGRWRKGPGIELFRTIERRLGKLPIIAEDLGFLTPRVKKLLSDSGFPGMKILEFAFDPRETSDYLPERYSENSVVYTGTHDNETVVGWYENIDIESKSFCDEYLKEFDGEINWKFIQCIFKSKSIMAIAPMQDILGLGNEARINTPGVLSGNWQWRLKKYQLSDEVADKLKKITLEWKR